MPNVAEVDFLPDGRKLLPRLTPRQVECLRTIYDFAMTHRQYPLGREIGDAMGVKAAYVGELLIALEQKGYLTRGAPTTRRSLRLTASGIDTVQDYFPELASKPFDSLSRPPAPVTYAFSSNLNLNH